MPVRRATPEEMRKRFGNGLIIFGQKPPAQYLENLKKQREAEACDTKRRR